MIWLWVYALARRKALAWAGRELLGEYTAWREAGFSDSAYLEDVAGYHVWSRESPVGRIAWLLGKREPNCYYRRSPLLLWKVVEHRLFGYRRGCSCTACFSRRRG